jgi:hypothetical protein
LANIANAAMVIRMSAVGKVEAKSTCACFNKLANHIGATSRGSNSSNNFCATKSFSNGHGLSANGEPQTYQNLMTILQVVITLWGMIYPNTSEAFKNSYVKGR